MPQRGVAFSATYEVVDRSTGAYVTGDVGNHSILFALDGIETSPTNAPAELSHGEYAIALTALEMQAASVTVYGSSSTANALIIPTRISTDVIEVPESAPTNSPTILPGGTFAFPFFTRNGSGSLVDADSTPTLVVYRNFASTAIACTLGHQGTGQYNGSIVLSSPWVNGDTGYVLVSATITGVPLTEAFYFSVNVNTVALAANQSFNNTGQVTPVPALPAPSYSVESVLDGSASTTYTGVTIRGALNYPFNFTWIYPIDLTGFSQVVWTAKTAETDPDSAAVLTIQLSNPGSVTDGLTLLNGAAPVSPTTKTDGALVITITPAAGLVAASTSIQLILTARGMGLAVAASLNWEITAYLSGVKQPVVDGGIFDVEGTVRQSPVQS